MDFTINKIEFSRDIVIVPVADRWYRIPHKFQITVLTDCGKLVFSIDSDFMFDGRSGGPFVDALGISNLGTQDLVKSWLFHDINFYDVYFTFQESNEILYMMLKKAGMGWFKARSVYVAVGMAESHFGEPKPNDKEYINIPKIHVSHYDK